MLRPATKHGRGDQILQHASATARVLLNASGADSNSPYLKSIAGISILLWTHCRAQRLSLLERIHEIISVIINICGEGRMPTPSILRNLSQFLDTLQKVYSFVRSQVDLGLFQRVLRHAETAALLEDCNAGLRQASDVFRIQAGLETSAIIADVKKNTEIRHEELMELLQEANSSKSSASEAAIFPASTSSLYLLPASPKIFYGRDGEVHELIKVLLGPDPGRTAILGPGGIGKSSLALAVLHHEDLVSRFGSRRYFISLESSTSAADMFTTIAAFFDIDASAKDCWGNLSSRAEVEDFLSLLSEISHLQLMVTMRGAERPGQVKWTRPFLLPLDRLNDMAARQTFLDIVDQIEDDELTALLALTDNLPLAITLMANVASFEGAESLLNRWADETPSLLSEGFNKESNLDKSITISLSSARMLSNPQARGLLSLMSLLPDGLSEDALMQMKLPFSPHVARSKSTLLRCSLIYSAADGRLRTLAPIREYVRGKFPPSAESFDGLRAYFYDLTGLFRNFTDLPNRELIQRLSSEFTNIRAVTTYALAKSLHLEATVRCTIDLLHFNASAKTGSFDFSDAVDKAVESLGDLQLKGDYLLAQMRLQLGRSECRDIASAAVRCFEVTQDLSGQARGLYMLSSHLMLTGQFQEALDAAGRGTRLAQQSGNLSLQALCHSASSEAYRVMGDQQKALSHGGEAQRLSQASGNLTAEVWVTQQYAVCCGMVGDYAQTMELCASLTSILSALGLANLEVHVYNNILNINAEILDRRTEYDVARALHAGTSSRENIDTARHIVPPAVWKAAGLDILAGILEADLNFRNGEYEKAQKGFKPAVTDSVWPDLAILAMEKLSNVALKTSDLQAAMHYSVLFLAAAGKSHDLAATHQALRRLGDISLARGDEATAVNLFQVALDGFKLMGIHRGEGDCLVRMGDVQNSRGDQSQAREMWIDARACFERSSQKAEVARCDDRIAQS
ncbi:hypothetical protein DFH09DRAFT_1472168 [Mycena vulgaris]|nr:hypothetical protein DFH09DRAFT_1472168 [Mycena vulgaris]